MILTKIGQVFVTRASNTQLYSFRRVGYYVRRDYRSVSFTKSTLFQYKNLTNYMIVFQRIEAFGEGSQKRRGEGPKRGRTSCSSGDCTKERESRREAFRTIRSTRVLQQPSPLHRGAASEEHQSVSAQVPCEHFVTRVFEEVRIS